ncbi:MAG: hypothetical protein Q8O92_02085 [Candidatus Latescibacter sp.]|nr:hypothetical protein [Candidatus Latescibacter sp.]
MLVLSFINGCGDNVSRSKGKKWEGTKITLETVFTTAFDNLTWTPGQNVMNEVLSPTAFGMQEGLKNQVVVKGKMSQAIHDYMVDQLNKTSQVAAFTEALRFAVKLNKDGKLAQDPLAKFDLKAYPVSDNGEVDVDKAESFLYSEDNKDKVDALLTWFKKRYWEPGTDVMIVLSLVARGQVIKISYAKNSFWDNDVKYTNHTEIIMNAIFQYVQNTSAKK